MGEYDIIHKLCNFSIKHFAAAFHHAVDKVL